MNTSTVHREAGSGVNTALLAALIVSSMFIGSGGGAAPIDMVLGLAAAQVLVMVVFATRPRMDVAEPLTFFLIAVSVYLGLAIVGIIWHNGTISQLVMDLVSVTYFVVALNLLSTLTPRQLRWLCVILAYSTAIFSIATIIEESVRPTGLMSNPNMAATWLGLSVILLSASAGAIKLRWRIAAISLAFGALIETDSYTALLAFCLVAVYVLAKSKHRVAATALLVAFCLVLALLWDSLSGAVKSPARLANSEGSRRIIWDVAWQVWIDHPLGIGHGNFVHQQTYSSGVHTHNDYLSALVEGGPIGVVALLGIGLAIWLNGGKVTRCMLIYAATSAFFHNVLNFRHVWIFLAMALVLDRFPAKGRDTHQKGGESIHVGEDYR